MDGFLLTVALLAWGAQAVVPWRLTGLDPGRRRGWAVSLLPLLAAGSLAAYAFLQDHPDAAVVQGLYPFATSRTGRLFAILLLAVALSDLLIAAGWRRFEPLAWRLAAGFGLVFLLAASWAGELMRIGEGLSGSPLPVVLLTFLRLLTSLAAGEALAPGRPAAAPLAGAGLPLYWLLLPAPLAQALARNPAIFTLGAATLLLLAARWLPPSLRRLALGAGVLLAGLFLAQAASLSQGLGTLG